MANAIINILFGVSEPGHIGNLVLDATLRENHQFTNRVTSFPVESGSTIQDHIIQEPESVTINGFVTNTPVRFLDALRGDRSDSLVGRITGVKGIPRLDDAFEKLMQIAGYDYPIQMDENGKETRTKNTVKLIKIVTGLRAYSDMVITSLSIPRDKNTGQVLIFDATFQKVKFTELEFEERLSENKISEDTDGSKRSKKQAESEKDIGVKKTPPPPESVANKGLNKLTAFFK